MARRPRDCRERSASDGDEATAGKSAATDAGAAAGAGGSASGNDAGAPGNTAEAGQPGSSADPFGAVVKFRNNVTIGGAPVTLSLVIGTGGQTRRYLVCAHQPLQPRCA